MSALYHWSESNGAEAITDDISNLNFGSNDAPNLNTLTWAVIRGTASYEKYIRAKFTDLFTEISNMTFWRSDVNGYKTGETLKCAYNVTFATPSQTPNGDDNIPLTSGGSAAIQSYEGASTILAGPGVSGYTKYMRLQLQTSGSTPSGVMYQKTLCFQYDEV